MGMPIQKENTAMKQTNTRNEEANELAGISDGKKKNNKNNKMIGNE